MPESEPGRIRRFSEDHRLEAAGFQWQEQNRRMFNTAAWLYSGACFLIALSVALFLASSQPNAAIFPLAIGLICAVLGFAATGGKIQRQRSIIFESDGRILAPDGLPSFESFKEVQGHHDDIQSIEVQPNAMAGGCNVFFYSYHGNIVTLSGITNYNSAYKISTELNIALREIRNTAGA
jgi:hypothetical protein